MATAPLFDVGTVVLDELGPERIFHVYDPATSLRAAVVVDHRRMGMSGGGVRMAPDMSLREIARLARAMTLKNALYDAPTGGGKAGIWADPAAPGREARVAAFLDAIKPLTDVGMFMPGPDMGTSFADLEPLYGSSTPLAELGRRQFEGMPLEEQLTGYGVVCAAGAALRSRGASLKGARVAMEGFGKVGAGAAKFLAREEARLVAVSTLQGTLTDPAGLDIARLLSLREKHGDAAITKYEGGTQLPREALYATEADVLIPGARPDALHRDNAGSVRAKLIVPAANIPYGEGIVEALEARGIVALPDFVTNAGGVVAVLGAMSGGDDASTFEMVRSRVDSVTTRVLEAAREGRTSAYAAAVGLARKALADAA